MSITKADLIEILKDLEISEVLREEQDIHSVFAFTKFLNQGVDAHFDCRIRDLVLGELPGKASDYWKQISSISPFDGAITTLTQLHVALYSKKAFSTASFKTKIPVSASDFGLFMGFEDDSNVGTGMSSFRCSQIAGILKLEACVGGNFRGYDLDISTALPADAAIVKHVYSVHLLRPWSEFYIDSSLVCIFLNGPNLDFAHPISGPPYGIFAGDAPTATPMLALIESQGAGLTVPLGPYYVRLSNIPELPPRVFRLYQTATNNLLVGLVVNPNVTSHPVPLLGYSSKTLLFRANGNGTLSIQVLTQANNWREYDSVTVVANTLLSYIMTGDAVLARIVFTPTTPPATITDAEVVLR